VPKTAVPVNAPKNWVVRFAFPLFVLICCAVGLVLFRTSLRSLPRGYPDLPDMTGVNPILRELLQRKDANARRHADSAEALGGLARAYHANHFRESAKLAYQLATRLDPNDYRWFYCEALLEEDSAEPRTLVELLERTIQLQNYLPAYQKLAEHFSKGDELQKSADMYGRILKLDPSFVWAVVGQARISARQGNWSFVNQNLEPIARQYPRVRAVHQLLADAYQAIGRPDQALESIKILAQSNLVPIPRVSDPQRDQIDDLCYLSTPLLKLAYAAATTGQYEKMLQWSRRAVEVDTGDADAHHFLARALILARGADSDVFAEAMAQRDEGLRLRADDPEPLMMLGQALMDRSNFKAAIRQFEMLLTRKPEHAEAHNSMAIALTGEGRFAGPSPIVRRQSD
jgi:tetratricopeptide (TPR) repeat protein